MKNIPLDKSILYQFLKSGYMETGKLFPTELGTPQGGTISTTICNMVLDGLEPLLKAHFKDFRYHELLHHPDVHCNEVPYEAGDHKEQQIRPLHKRSQIYLAFLQLLDLEEKHHRNLLNRGLSEESIVGNMYRSIPTDYAKRQKAVELLSKQYDLTDVPGFYTKNNKW